MRTIYPRTKFVDEVSRSEQFDHLKTEFHEVITACIYEGVERFTEEICDLIHSAESLLLIMEKQGVDVGKIQQEVIKKNRARGYYSE